MAQPDDEICDYPFSIRIPKSLAQDINRRAASEGMKASAWARKALEYSLYQMGADERKISAASLIELIKYDPDVRSTLSNLFNEFMSSDLVICDEDGNIIDIEDEPISPIKRLISKFHRSDESMEVPEHIDEIHHIEQRPHSLQSRKGNISLSNNEEMLTDIDDKHKNTNVN